MPVAEASTFSHLATPSSRTAPERRQGRARGRVLREGCVKDVGGVIGGMLGSCPRTWGSTLKVRARQGRRAAWYFVAALVLCLGWPSPRIPSAGVPTQPPPRPPPADESTTVSDPTPPDSTTTARIRTTRHPVHAVTSSCCWFSCSRWPPAPLAPPTPAHSGCHWSRGGRPGSSQSAKTLPLRTPTLGAGAPAVVSQWSFPLSGAHLRHLAPPSVESNATSRTRRSSNGRTIRSSIGNAPGESLTRRRVQQCPGS